MRPMPERNPDEPPIRPEVVQAIFSALVDLDPEKLAPLAAAQVTVTPAERAQAKDLYAASLRASQDQRGRWLEAMKVLIAGRDLSAGGSWADLFDGLGPEQVSELRGLYDAMPDDARAEYDRRYGRPEDT